jgi:hypothetical protein
VSGYDDWTCRGGDQPHRADLELSEALPDYGSTSVTIERCRACGTLYRHHRFEVSDWGPNGDYYSQTHGWTVLAADEVDALRTNPAYEPKAEPAHRWDGGWRSG